MAIPTKFKVSRRTALIGVSLVALFFFGLFAWQAYSASRALMNARTDAKTVQDQIQAGNFDGASRTLADLRDKAHTAHDETGGFLWDVAGHIPYLGRNISAIQTVSEVLDTATTINAPIALQLSQALGEGKFRPVNGRIDLAEVKKLTPGVDQARASIDQAGRSLDQINANSLLFPFNDMISRLQVQVDTARTAANSTATAFDLLPQMLGETKARTYLLIIQNPAELRSTGGLPGSVAILHAQGGQLTMGWQGSATDIKGFSGPVVKLPADTESMYGSTIASDFRDIGFTPDFTAAAQVARVMVKQKLGVNVDGVISVDPIALSEVLSASGKVVVDGHQLDSTNVVTTLLNTVYVDNNPSTCGSDVVCIQRDLSAQDRFFADAAKTIFNAVMSGQGSQQLAVRALGTATSEHRVLLWSNDPTEEARLVGTAISGQLPRDTGHSPQIGMYLNNTSASKMDYYLRYQTSATALACRDDGAQDLRVTASFASAMPTKFGGLGLSVLGNGQFAKQGHISFNLRFYAPYGGQITDLEVDSTPADITADKHYGRQVAFLPVSLAPGEHTTITVDFRTRKGQSGNGSFSYTPGILEAANGSEIVSACD